jgi:adenylylsulfate kinase
MKCHVSREIACPAPGTDIVRQALAVTRTQRESANGHRGTVVWLTGQPGSGKSTIANATERTLHARGMQTVVLDGDNMRLGLCADLGFSDADRDENVRRVAETARLFLENGAVVIVALVSPHRQARDHARQLIGAADFLEIYCSCEPAICEQRDPKGHYARARRGEIAGFTGVSSRYEAPLAPTLVLETGMLPADDSVRQLTRLILAKCETP